MALGISRDPRGYNQAVPSCTHEYTSDKKGVPSRISPRDSGTLPLLHATMLLQQVLPAMSRARTSSDGATLYSCPDIVMLIEMLRSHGMFWLLDSPTWGTAAHPSSGVCSVSFCLWNCAEKALGDASRYVDCVVARIERALL